MSINSEASDAQKPQMKLAWFIPRLFVIAVPVNYIWENVQAPLYVGMESFELVWWHCGLAAMGDGLLVQLIYAVGWAVLRRRDWFMRPGIAGFAVLLTAGLVISIGIEWLAVFGVNRWAYTGQMPLVPLLNIGLAPVAQMLVLPPLIFRIVAAWHGRASAARQVRGLIKSFCWANMLEKKRKGGT